MPPLFELNNLSVAYGAATAIAGVNLQVLRQSITAFIGPSGCGKTSLLSCFNLMTAQLPGCRVSGGLRMDGQDLLAPETNLRALRQRVGMIFQKPNPFPLSIRRNLELPLAESGLSRTERRERGVQALRDVGLWEEVRDRLDAPAMALSGGQQQRLCIARALVLQPEVLLMDEPCSALDPMASGVVEDLIIRLGQRLTVIVVTHNLQQARRVAGVTGVFWTEDGVGRLVEVGPTESIFAAPADARAAAYVQGLRG